MTGTQKARAARQRGTGPEKRKGARSGSIVTEPGLYRFTSLIVDRDMMFLRGAAAPELLDMAGIEPMPTDDGFLVSKSRLGSLREAAATSRVIVRVVEVGAA